MSKNKLQFLDKFPQQYTLLQCLRKSLLLDENMKLSIRKCFYLNETEFKFFGYRIEDLDIGKVTKNKWGHYKVIYNKESILRIRMLFEKIKFEGF